MLRSFRLLPALAAAGILLVPAAANAKVVYPTVTSVSPLKLALGQKLTIKGKNFRRGAFKNTVVFKRDGVAPVFVRADAATTRKIVLTVPQSLGQHMKDAKGVVRSRRWQLRVISARFAKTYTKKSLSPVVTPPAAPAPPAPLTPYEQCQASVTANPAADQDGDGMVSNLETAVGTDPCKADTDGDAIPDGYEYYSAIDLNSAALPFPGKRPWPNPLDPSDPSFDFDGDGLTLANEYTLWKYVGGAFPLTAYSDGSQNTGGTQPTIGDAARQKLDLDGDGNLTDDERDADGDGLSNIVEIRFRGIQSWWTSAYKDEAAYTEAKFHELSPVETDTDGDTLPDGADDQDHDGWSNFQEMEVSRGAQGIRVQPYNPCLPDPYSRTCSRYAPFDNPWPPFDGSKAPPLGSAIPFSWPIGTMAVAPDPGWNGNGGPQGP